MTDYILELSSYGGIVAGAVHWRGRVKGPLPRSCHGGTVFNAPESRGKTTCTEGHELPGRIEWEVEQAWTAEQHERYAARHFEGDSPFRFRTAMAVVETAIARFQGELPAREHDEKTYPGEPGDRLFLDCIPFDESDIDAEWGRQQGTPPYGSILAEIPVSRLLTQAERIALRHWLQVLSEQSKAVRVALGEPRLKITTAVWQGQWNDLTAKLSSITEDLCGRAEPEGPSGAPAGSDEPASEPEGSPAV
jgi:hypothetical protein